MIGNRGLRLIARCGLPAPKAIAVPPHTVATVEFRAIADTVLRSI